MLPIAQPLETVCRQTSGRAAEPGAMLCASLGLPEAPGRIFGIVSSLYLSHSLAPELGIRAPKLGSQHRRYRLCKDLYTLRTRVWDLVAIGGSSICRNPTGWLVAPWIVADGLVLSGVFTRVIFRNGWRWSRWIELFVFLDVVQRSNLY